MAQFDENGALPKCIFCRFHNEPDCWHSPEYEPVARALAVAFTGEPEPSDEQVGWYVDDAEELGSDLWHYLGRETPLTVRDLGFLDREPDMHAVVFNERLVVTLQTVEGTGESMAHAVADLRTPPASTTCKHCGLSIDGGVHAEGLQRGKMRCAADPYGFNAEPVGTECRPTCNGEGGREPNRVYPPGPDGPR